MADLLTLWAEKIRTLENENLGLKWEILQKNSKIEQLKRENEELKSKQGEGNASNRFWRNA